MLLELQQDLKNVNRRIDEKMGKKEETNFESNLAFITEAP